MRKLLIVVLALVGFLPTNAQYTFTLSVSWSGNCSGYTSQMNQAIRGFQSQAINGFPTRELCEQTRAMCQQELGHIELLWIDQKTGKVVKREATNCRLNVSTTPCTGRPMAGNTIQIGAPNINGVSQGTSFYSTNSANEIRNWSEDDAMRRMGLDRDYKSFDPTIVSTGDIDFDNTRTFVSLDMRDGGSNAQQGDIYFGEVLGPNDERWKYFLNEDKEFIDELHQEYLNEFGVDILSFLLKKNLTEEDLLILYDYKKWKEQKQIEYHTYMNMAIGSEVVYADSKHELLDKMDFEFIKKEDWNKNESIQRLLQIVDLCNNASFNQGFHAEILRNKDTNEYMIAFRGTEVPYKEIVPVLDALLTIKLRVDKKDLTKAVITLGEELNQGKDATETLAKSLIALFDDNIIKDIAEGNTQNLPKFFHDVSTDVTQALNKVLSQYKMAIAIGEVIRQITEEHPEIRINITGHSMGGGEGIIVGLISGQPTYVFNPAGVSDATIDYAGVRDKVDSGTYNIHKFTTPDDPLTNFQESNDDKWKKWRKIAKDLAIKYGADPKIEFPKAIGTEYHIITNEGHSMLPIAKVIAKREEAMGRIISNENNTVNIYFK